MLSTQHCLGTEHTFSKKKKKKKISLIKNFFDGGTSNSQELLVCFWILILRQCFCSLMSTSFLGLWL